MHQVIMNLCTNAYHAMITGGGTLTVIKILAKAFGPYFTTKEIGRGTTCSTNTAAPLKKIQGG